MTGTTFSVQSTDWGCCIRFKIAVHAAAEAGVV
jgi:hypothetical protein